MKLFLSSCLAAACFLVLPSFAFTPSSPATSQSGGQTATLKIDSVTHTVTIVINADGSQTETTVRTLSCSGAANDCRINRAGEPVPASPPVFQ